MFTLASDIAVYLHRAPIDFRRGVNGLSALVEHELKLDPFARACFVFSNKRRDRVKLLGWDTNGFWLCIKRLEAERFIWPRTEEPVVNLTAEQLHWLLAGIDLAALAGHRALHFARAS